MSCLLRIALATALALPLVALAQTPAPRVWLGPMQAENAPGAGMISEKFDEGTRNELRKSKRLELMGEGRTVAVEAGAPDPRVDQAETLRSAGKASFAKKDYEGALKQLKGALDLYEEALASVNKIEAITETLGYLGAASLALEYDDDARDYFRRVLALMPDAGPLDDYPAASAKLFEKLKGQAAKKKKGSLTVKTEPAGATVKVDGVDRGKSPVTVADLPRGDHYVQVSHDEAGLGAEKVAVKGGAQDATIKLSKDVGPEPSKPADPALAKELTRMATEGQLGAPFRNKADTVAEQTRAQYVVVGHIVAQGNNFVLKSYLYGVEQKQVAAFDEMRFRADLASVFVQAAGFAKMIEDAVNEFPYDKVVVGGIVAASKVPPPAEAPPPDEPKIEVPAPTEPPKKPKRDEEDEAWYTQWWVWTIAGAAVIGGTAYGGYVLLQDEPQSGNINATVRW